ncbi:MAG TPA: hypothetical protein DD412_08565 [Holosporales bacterium]|nr:hypothetical protein [Holosporales bacterium]
MVYSLPAFISLLATFVALKNSLFSLGTQKLVEDEPYGSARLCSAQEAISKNDKNGLPIGRILSSVKGDDVNLIKKIKTSKVGEIFRYKPIHSFIIAPTRAGKGVGFIVPTLLDYDGPIICIDPKSAENFAITARRRRKNGTRQVHVFDTCDLTGQETACLNIFDFIDLNNPKVVDTIKGISAYLSPEIGDQKDKYWQRGAQRILTCLIIHVASLPKEQQSLSTVLDLLSTPYKELWTAFQNIYENTELAGGAASRAAAKALSTDKKEISYKISSARDALDWLDSPAYRHMTSSTSFKMEDVFENKADIFFCIPVDEIISHGHYFIKLAISLLVKEMTSLKHPPKENVLFLLDEMAAIGQIREVNSILLTGAGYKISLIGVAQSIEALQTVYPQDIKTMLSSSLLLFLGITNVEDREYVSRYLGYKTTFTESDATNEKDSQSNVGHTKSAVKREVLNPDEVLGLGSEFLIAIAQGLKPLVLKRLSYYLEKEFKGSFDESKFNV